LSDFEVQGDQLWVAGRPVPVLQTIPGDEYTAFEIPLGERDDIMMGFVYEEDGNHWVSVDYTDKFVAQLGYEPEFAVTETEIRVVKYWDEPTPGRRIASMIFDVWRQPCETAEEFWGFVRQLSSLPLNL
jgi:hypothetical protein